MATERLPRQGVLLGIDFGSARVGIARSDATQMLATPVAVIRADGRSLAEIAGKIGELCSADCAGLVLGWPDEDDERTAPVRQRIRALADVLAACCPLPQTFVPEGFSSREARELLQASGKRLKPGQPIDDWAAAVILQRHLDEISR